jgi:cytokinesis protein
LAYWNGGEAHHLVVGGLEVLSSSNNEGGGGCYAYWFKSMEHSLSGRGKMGSLVGASEEVKRTGGTDSSLNEYAVSMPFHAKYLLRLYSLNAYSSPIWS